MEYDHDLGRFLALCLKAEKSYEEAYYIASKDFDTMLGSPEILDHWGRTYRDKINEEHSALPNVHNGEQLADLMADALMYLGDELQFILPSSEGRDNVDDTPDLEAGLTEAYSDDAVPMTIAKDDDNSPDSRLPRELIEVKEKVEEIEKILLGMLKDRGIDIDRIAA